MKVAAHITFFYMENRIPYLKETIANLQTLQADLTVNVYSNEKFDVSEFGQNVFLKIYGYSKQGKNKYSLLKSKFCNFLKIKNNIHPFHLAWESRHIIFKTRNDFDAQIYIEDDITFNQKKFAYWLKHKDVLVQNNFNLGFLRFEIDTENRVFATDLLDKIEKRIKLENIDYLINDNNPYCGFWIYDKAELKKFTKSREWKFKFEDYMTREKAAIGMHGINMKFYKNTVIPLELNEQNKMQINEGCLVHHLPNNYIGDHEFCKIELPIKF
jgi:hypothetical protein